MIAILLVPWCPEYLLSLGVGLAQYFDYDYKYGYFIWTRSTWQDNKYAYVTAWSETFGPRLLQDEVTHGLALVPCISYRL